MSRHTFGWSRLRYPSQAERGQFRVDGEPGRRQAQQQFAVLHRDQGGADPSGQVPCRHSGEGGHQVQ
jgi:hypothetical protein